MYASVMTSVATQQYQELSVSALLFLDDTFLKPILCKLIVSNTSSSVCQNKNECSKYSMFGVITVSVSLLPCTNFSSKEKGWK